MMNKQLSFTALLFIYSITFRIDAQTDSQWLPKTANCFNLSRAGEVPRHTDQRLNVYVLWSEYRDRRDNTTLLYTNYTWRYEMRKVDGEKEHPVDVTEYLDKARGGSYLSLPAYAMSPGFYKLTVEGEPRNQGFLRPLQKTCYVIYEAYKPIVIISGGTYKMVPPNTEIELNGEESLDINSKIPSNVGLEYYWTCKQTKGSNFCDKQPLSTSSKLIIPEKYIEENEKFEITLTVTTPSDNKGGFTEKNSFTQIIEVEQRAALIEITCMKNCPPATDFSNSDYITFLRVTCLSHCGTIQNEDYVWTIEASGDPNFQFDYDNSTQFGRNNYKFIILKKVMQPGNYAVHVKLKDSAPKKGHSTIELKFPSPPSVRRCNTNPRNGTTMTMFTIACSPRNVTNGHYLELYAEDKLDSTRTELIVFGYYPLDSHEFTLPSSVEYRFWVKVVKQGASKNLDLNTQVNATLSDEKDSGKFINTIESNYSKAAANILSQEETERERAMQEFKSLVNEIVQKKIGSEDKVLMDFIQDLKFQVVEDMLKASPDTVDDVLRMSETVTKLLNHQAPPESNALLGKFTTTICKKMMYKHLELVRKNKFPLNLGEKSNKISRAMSECLSSNTKPNYNIIKPLEQNISTEQPVFDIPIITENYANYVDFTDEYYVNLEYLKESTYNILNTTALSAKVLAMTTAVGEKFIETFGKESATIVAKDSGKVLAQSTLRSKRVVLLPSQDFIDDEHPYDILVNTWDQDIMWWNPAKTRVATDIASIQFWHSTCKEQVKTFTKPALLFFEVNQDKLTTILLVETFVVPQGYANMADDELNYQIKVRRIAVPKNIALCVQFYNLENSLKVITTKFWYPTIADFANSVVFIPGTNPSITVFNDEAYDICYYLAVLADKEVTADEVTYSISLQVNTCVRWIEYNNSWIPACQPGNENNLTVINCACTNFSVIAGYIQNIESTLQEVIGPELELELESCKVVFKTVLITLGFYCLMSLFLVRKTKNEVYFLGDNERKHRFAYIIVIKTGKGRYSSTTSNVVIKVTGTKNSSDPHVLNYPDPELRLLQKFGKDIFLMTTEQHLGDIVEIEIWFDSTGSNPDWYCKNILVYDMQQHTEWYFKVEKHLTVTKDQTFILTKPGTKDVNRSQYHTWFFWHKEETFTYIKKLTVVLSKILTTYSLTMMFHEVPALQLSDSLDRPKYNFDVSNLLVVFGSSSLAFIMHIGIAWTFRLSKNQYSRYNPKENMPFHVTVTCWLVLTFLVVVSISFLTIFGFWLPFNSSMVWLTSSLIAILFQIFVYEITFLFLSKFICKLNVVHNIGTRFHDIWKWTESQRVYLYKQFGDTLLRSYFGHLYKPLDHLQIKEKKIQIQRRRYVISQIEDLIMFGIYVAILYAVVLVNKDHLILQNKLMMEEAMDGKLTRSLRFNDLEYVQQIYNYIDITFIPTIQPNLWYGNFVISEPGLMIDVNNKYLGIARIRQQRILSNASCFVPENLKFLNISCQPEISPFLVESRAHGYGWGKFTAYLHFDRLRFIWQYTTAQKTGTFATFGEYATYTGGGYVSYLGRTLYNSYANFRKFLQKHWIDQNTRTVFLEFLTYNANYNVFCAVTLHFEQSSSGHTIKTINIEAVRMLFVQNEVEQITVTFFTLFVVWVVMFFLKQTIGFLKKLRNFYKDPWSLLDSLIVLMSLICACLYGLRIYLIGQYLNELEKKKRNEFLNYFYLFYLEEFLKVFAATLVCVATIRLWKFLRFGKNFLVLEQTISLSAASLLTLTFSFFLLLLGCSMTLVLLYGNNFEEINTIVRTIRLLTLMAFRSSVLNLEEYVQYRIAVIFFVFYGILLKIIVVIYIIIIVVEYAEAQMEFSSESVGYTIKNYIEERVMYFPRLFKYKYKHLRGGNLQTKKVESKDDKFINLNSFSVSADRMVMMKYVTKGFLRKMKRSSHFDIKFMLNICRETLGKAQETEKVERFYKGRVKGRKITIVDERRILKVAKVVQYLVNDLEITDLFVERTENEVKLRECIMIIKENRQILSNCYRVLKLALHELDTVEVGLLKSVSLDRS